MQATVTIQGMKCNSAAITTKWRKKKKTLTVSIRIKVLATQRLWFGDVVAALFNSLQNSNVYVYVNED